MAFPRRPGISMASARAMAPALAGQRRAMRRPRHTFNLQYRPFQIQPFCLAPVWPGETLENALLQVRTYTDPILAPHIGWWLDHHLFYVKHRDLAGRADFTAMMLDPDKDLSAYKTAADVEYYHGASMLQWAKLCYIEVVEQYFRDEDDGAWNSFTIGNMAAAGIVGQTWLESALLDDHYIVDNMAVDLDASGTITAEEVQRALRLWELYQSHNITDMTYEDYLKTYGINVDESVQEAHVPERIRSWSDWTYPTNTIDNTTGAPRSACSWVVAGRADKNRFFREPGFIFGVTVCRPKVYLKNLDGAAAEALDSAMAWIPAVLWDDPRTSMRKESATTGPLATIVTDAGGYWFDVKDIALYGDQFRNYANTTTGVNIVDLPNAAMTNKRYPSSTDVDSFFVSASPANKVRSDGSLNLTIASKIRDTSPGTPATS